MNTANVDKIFSKRGIKHFFYCISNMYKYINNNYKKIKCKI